MSTRNNDRRNDLPTSHHLSSPSTQPHHTAGDEGEKESQGSDQRSLITFTNSMWSFPVNVETSPWTLSFPFLMLMGMISS